MAFSKAHLLELLRQLPVPRKYWLAFSGGLDSTVLLQALATLRPELAAPMHAIHADHRLQPESTAWTDHCHACCRDLHVPFTKVTLDIGHGAGESLEAQAREARDSAFAHELGAGDMLLTAHHGDDQVETLLLQLMRGAGVSGLSAMPVVRAWNGGWLARPLLGFSRDELETWAREKSLGWIEDFSNQDRDFDRNYLRHEVVPRLRQRWPGLVKTVSRSARHCATAAKLVTDLAEADFKSCTTEEKPYGLAVGALKGLSRPRQENLLRFWIRENGFPLPDSHRLRRILEEVVSARADADPLVSWQGAEIRRFADELRLMPVLENPQPGWQQPWSGQETLELPGGLGKLAVASAGGPAAIAREYFDTGRVSVAFRREGLRCTPVGREGSRSFKRLCQDLGIPPWLRGRLPLVFVGGDLAAVAGYTVCMPFAAKAGEAGFSVQWKRKKYLY